MKESLLCSDLVFLADTPKSAGRHVFQIQKLATGRCHRLFPHVATQTKLVQNELLYPPAAQPLILSVREMNTK